MFNFIFSNNKITPSNLWFDALSEKEGKKLAMQAAMGSSALAVQSELKAQTQQSLISQAHSVYAMSGDDGDEQQIGDIYSELDTLPLPSLPFSLAI